MAKHRNVATVEVSAEVLVWLQHALQYVDECKKAGELPATGEFLFTWDLNMKAALIALDQAAASIAPATCEHCGRRIVQMGTGRDAHYCSTRCRVAAHRKRQKRAAIKAQA